MNQRAIEKTELNKILSLVAEYAVLEGSKNMLEEMEPACELSRRFRYEKPYCL